MVACARACPQQTKGGPLVSSLSPPLSSGEQMVLKYHCWSFPSLLTLQKEQKRLLPFSLFLPTSQTTLWTNESRRTLQAWARPAHPCLGLNYTRLTIHCGVPRAQRHVSERGEARVGGEGPLSPGRGTRMTDVWPPPGSITYSMGDHLSQREATLGWFGRWTGGKKRYCIHAIN